MISQANNIIFGYGISFEIIDERIIELFTGREQLRLQYHLKFGYWTRINLVPG